jgi:phosphoglycerol transferase MdoB-like AlkP superfamily enzyme
LFIFVDFFYYLQYCLIAYFFVSELKGEGLQNLSSRVLKAGIFLVFTILAGMTIYFTVSLINNEKTYRNCHDPILITSRVLGLILIAIYFYIALRVSYTLKSMKNALDNRKYRENIRDMW